MQPVSDSTQPLIVALETCGLLLLQDKSFPSVISSGKAAKEIESRLLVHGEQLYTDSGNHKIRLEPWNLWAVRHGCATTISDAKGRARLEAAVAALGGPIKILPWHALARRRRSNEPLARSATRLTCAGLARQAAAG